MSITRSEKRCPRCSKTKDISEFSKCSTRADGRQGNCKECRKNMHLRVDSICVECKKPFKAYKNSEGIYCSKSCSIAVKNRGRLVVGSEEMRDLARTVVARVIRNSPRLKSRQCSSCLDYCDTVAHHDDYTKPLEVSWLCRSCHLKLHHGAQINRKTVVLQ